MPTPPISRMKNSLLACATLAFLYTAVPAMAQDGAANAQPVQGHGAEGEGAVGGTVIDPATGEYLRNAIIHVTTATGRRTVRSGARGEYRIGGLPAGPVEIVVSFTGYAEAGASLELGAGESRREDFELYSTAAGERPDTTLDRMVVTGVRQGDARAIMEQR